jgi:serine phosphatase RsbU (regulator of sigma subunit)
VKSFLRSYFVFLTFLYSFSLTAVPDSLVYRIGAKEHLNITFTGNLKQEIRSSKRLVNCFLYKIGSNYKWATPAFNDSAWTKIHPDLEDLAAHTDTIPVLWLRLHFRAAPDMLHKTIGLKMEHLGASEIYLDGKLLRAYGFVSNDVKEEICENPKNSIIGFSLNDTLEHLLAIRYSNAHYTTYLNHDENTPGLNPGFIDFEEEYSSMNDFTTYVSIACASLFAFFLALSLVHLLIFSFDREKKFNLYHSIFVGIFGIIFLLPIIYQNSSNPVLTVKLKFYAEYLTPVFFISLLALLYNLFQKPLGKFFYICLISTGALILIRFLSEDLFDALCPFVFITIFVSSTVIAIKAIRQKLPGAKIVGWGVILFPLCILTAILISTLAAMIGKETLSGVGALVAVILLVFALLSMPVSMSVYLAVDFARANKTLKRQISQIEELSQQSLFQEQEKKQILENQNKLLEQQVTERTTEILTKNEILEDQKKEIMDSITYASRIQEAILPDINEIKKTLPQSFVLFKPKDIVSGDFYYFHNSSATLSKDILNASVFIAAVDCTGHGVPGAFMSMLGKESLDKAISISDVPSEILSLLNKFVKQSLKQDNNKDATRDGMDIAFCKIVSRENEAGAHIYFSGANRPIWIIRKDTREVQEIKATKTAIGGLTPTDQTFDQHEIILHPGDTIYLTSDGYADQFSPEDKKLMTRKFKEVLLSICDKPMHEQEKHLRDFHVNWKGLMEQTDDILVIGIRI